MQKAGVRWGDPEGRVGHALVSRLQWHFQEPGLPAQPLLLAWPAFSDGGHCSAHTPDAQTQWGGQRPGSGGIRAAPCHPSHDSPSLFPHLKLKTRVTGTTCAVSDVLPTALTQKQFRARITANTEHLPLDLNLGCLAQSMLLITITLSRKRISSRGWFGV